MTCTAGGRLVLKSGGARRLTLVVSPGSSAVADGQHRLWTSWWDGRLWSAPTDLGGVELSSEPTAITGGPHGIAVLYRSPNNHLWTIWWPDQPGGQFWRAPAHLGGRGSYIGAHRSRGTRPRPFQREPAKELHHAM